MTTHVLSPVINQLRRTVLLREGAVLSDSQLLESFIGQKDEAAFEALVRRHGPMVLGVCRRVLRNPHDAEDAFQATFLVLVRKADSIRPREMVANWLYGVAYRTALKARNLLARHRGREKQVTEMPEPEAARPDDCWRDLRPLLDRELSGLPDKYRLPLVLCDLEGKTGKDAAQQLGWPEGTVASRLSRGRGLLAKRLTRRGLVLSAGALATALSQNAASAGVPASLVSSTVKAASILAAGQALTTGLISAQVAALTEGVVRAMLLHKVRIALVLLAVIGIVGTGLGGVAYRALAGDDRAGPSGQLQVAQAVPPQQDKAVGQKAEPTDKPALDPNREAFLKAFQIASEMVKAQAKARTEEKKPGDPDLGKLLWEMMEKSYRPADKEALNKDREAFLKAFQLSSELAKAWNKGQAVEHVKKEIESALSRVKKTGQDGRTELEVLDEIQKAIQDLRKKIQERK